MPRMAVKAKEFRYAVDLDEGGSLRAEDGTPLDADPAWSPEHLLLAALVRCSLKSLRHEPRSLMPAYGADVLNARDLQDLVAYLQSLRAASPSREKGTSDGVR